MSRTPAFPAPPDPIIKRLHQLYDQSGLTLTQLGQRMGMHFPKERNQAFGFLYRNNDPKVSVLRRFCGALGITWAELFADDDLHYEPFPFPQPSQSSAPAQSQAAPMIEGRPAKKKASRPARSSPRPRQR